MFSRLLIANRGEIACRIAKTARKMGIHTIAIYSEADANARHVRLCDEAYLLGPAPARESYLCIERIIAIAKQSGAEAIHPGYGFLSENAEFAEACQQAGLIFIGPPVEAIRAMGSKSAAKQLMAAANVPLVPGYHAEAQGSAILSQAAATIGYPVLIKASAGGGGKGMRIVDSPAELETAIASAKREAKAAFGDDQLLLEKYLTHPRHIEIQIFADTHGQTVYLFERDCSIQRRHQKVLEEAPAPGMTQTQRGAMGEVAIAAARAIGYVGAGTVEFIVDEAGEFYFMEMNTRLQVEHPITEMITGQDLVEWQIRVAAGEALPLEQEQLTINGHAIEVRVYAEDPANHFLPATGQLVHLVAPQESSVVRVETGVSQGDTIGIHYDPMLAKLVVWGQDRQEAIRRLRQALTEYEVVGVTTNLEFLANLAAHPAFNQARINTSFIADYYAELVQEHSPINDTVLALAGLAQLLKLAQDVEKARQTSSDPYSPWYSTVNWRLNGQGSSLLHLHYQEHTVVMMARYRDNQLIELTLPSHKLQAHGNLEPNGRITAQVAGIHLEATAIWLNGQLNLIYAGRNYHFSLADSLIHEPGHHATDTDLTAPMAGTVVQIAVKPGESVQQGQPLIVLEAMKMEHAITAPCDGVISQVNYQVGQQVVEGAELVVFTIAEEA